MGRKYKERNEFGVDVFDLGHVVFEVLCLEPQQQMGAEDRCSPDHGDSLSGGWQHSTNSSQTFSLLIYYLWIFG